MKRFVSFLLALVLLAAVPASAEKPLGNDALAVSAPSAILIEKQTGTVLYEKEADMRLPPASVTKVMTMLVIMRAIESGKLREDDEVIASARAASFGGSCVYLEEGERMSARDMLKCIAVVSANDCAVAMAEHLCGSEELFVEQMNSVAAELGLENTHFTNCTGLFSDPEHYTSARDIALMSRELLKHGKIKEYTTIWMDSIRNGEFMLSNTNKLVYWYPGCTGLKTGFTSEAMYCLSASAERDGAEYIAVIMHAESSDARNNDAKLLLNYAFASFTLCPLPEEGTLPDVTVELGKDSSVRVKYAAVPYALIPKTAEAPEIRAELPDTLTAPLKQGEELGRALVITNGEVRAEIPLVCAKDVEKAGFFDYLAILARGLLGM